MEKIVQSYIITGSREASFSRALELAAGALCAGPGEKPCRSCRHCRKVFSGIHPDVTVVGRLADSKGKLRKDLLVDQIRAVAADASVLPNEAARKVYIFPDADTMNVSAQNAFLKLLEEPPSFVVFLLCAENSGLLLETVRSRCAELRAGDRESGFSEEAGTRAERWLAAAEDPAALLRCCVSMEKLETAQALEFVECARRLAVSRPIPPAELLALEEFLARAAVYLRANVGVKHVMGYLSTYTNHTK